MVTRPALQDEAEALAAWYAERWDEVEPRRGSAKTAEGGAAAPGGGAVLAGGGNVP